MSELRVAIRTDAGASVGAGHLWRSLSLARALKNIGAQANFILNGEARAFKLIQEQGFDVVAVEEDQDVELSAAAISRWRARVLITDSYKLKPNYFDRLSSYVGLMVTIDDLAEQKVPVDLVINSGMSVDRLNYPEASSILAGPRYAMLRQEFAEEPRRVHREHIRRILITVGGSDQSNLTQKLIDNALSLGDVTLDVAIGPFFENHLEMDAEGYQGRVFVHHDPQNMQSLMLKADLALTGGGQTAYELAATGTPAVAIRLAENQQGNLEGLEREGTLVNLGDAHAPDFAGKLVRTITELDSDFSRRKQMGLRGREVVDGRGAERVARAIAEEYNRGKVNKCESKLETVG